MKPKDFVTTYYPFAKETQDKTGISAVAILAQAAWESAWGAAAPGNMLFGVKDTDGINGNEQLLTTHEYSKLANAKFPNIISVEPCVLNGIKFFKYTIKDYFRKYNSPEESFTDHANYFINNPRYAQALKVRSNPELFIDAIAKAGYATDPNYAKNLKGLAKEIEGFIPAENHT